MEEALRLLIAAFQNNPWNYFHEAEVHARFAEIVRGRFGSAQTLDHRTVDLLRYEYNTLWRYQRSNVPEPFATRLPAWGKAGFIDFVLLDKNFVERSVYLMVMNKHEPIRQTLRHDPWPSDRLSPMIAEAIEFKMAHVHPFGPKPPLAYVKGIGTASWRA